MNLKQIIKILGKILLIGGIILFLFCQITFNQKVLLSIDYLNNQIQSILKLNNKLLLNDFKLLSFINDSEQNNLKAFKNLVDIVDSVDKKIPIEPNIQNLLNGSVFVIDLGGIGSGTIIKKTNKAMYILTCYHVIEITQKLCKHWRINIPVSIGYSKQDGLNNMNGMIFYAAEVIKYDKDKDLALLKTSFIDNELKVIPVADNEPEKGDIVYSVGNPFGLLRTISKGILSNKIEDDFYSDNTSTFGNSGGGLFNVRGELIGVPYKIIDYSLEQKEEKWTAPESGLGLSISLSVIKEFLKDTEYYN